MPRLVPNRRATLPAHRPAYLRQAHTPWTHTDLEQLRALARANTPTRVIGFKLGRSPGAVQRKASRLGVSLKPVNQSPYGRAA